MRETKINFHLIHSPDAKTQDPQSEKQFSLILIEYFMRKTVLSTTVYSLIQDIQMIPGDNKQNVLYL